MYLGCIPLFLNKNYYLYKKISEIVLLDSVVNIESFAVKLGCRFGSLPMTYLGLPLGYLWYSYFNNCDVGL